MLVTFAPIVLDHKRKKDNTYPVKIRVTFKGKQRKLPTSLVCKPTDLTRGSNKIKSNTILAKAEQIISQMRTAIKDLSPFDLETHDVDWIVGKIKETLQGDHFSLDFFVWADKYIMTKTATTRRAYSCALNTLERFLGSRELDINSITRMMLLDFMEYVDNAPKMHYNPTTKVYEESKKEKIAKAASTRHLMKLENIYKAAKDRYNDEDSGIILIPKSPFDKITKVFPPSDGQSSLGFETMQKIITAQVSNELIRLSLDVFIISFGLMGANMADIYTATPVKDVWIYNRQKTRSRRADQAEMRVSIPSVLKPYIERLQDGSSGWWLPRLHSFAKDKDFATQRINRALRKWAEDNGIPPFTFYAARHTWASLAKSKAKVEKAIIDECLVHVGDFKLTDIYAERDWELINDANQKVLDLFTWE